MINDVFVIIFFLLDKGKWAKILQFSFFYVSNVLPEA